MLTDPDAPSALEALFQDVRARLADVPQEALGVERVSRWRAPRIVAAGSAWHLGVLLITADAVHATGAVLRSARPVRRGYPAESARARAERRAAAFRGGFADGELVHVEWAPIDLAAVAAGAPSGPLALIDDVPSVRWSAAGGYMPLEAYLREQLVLLHRKG